jgi:outer membrane protein OmpA-like peptidoglycan-associated protein
MTRILTRLIFAIAILAAAVRPGGALAQDFMSQEWVLNPSLSNVYMQSVKKNAIFETHQFTAVEGTVSKDGAAKIKIELNSLETNHDLRNTRMRFLLFETFKFPFAEITAQLDKTVLAALAKTTRISYPLKFTLNMHGITKELETPVWVTRIGNTSVSVATVKPIIISAKTFGLEGGIAKLREAVKNIPIAAASSVTFDLVFGTGELKSGLVAARETREKARAEQASSTFSAEACETRFNVISKTGAIYFKTGSAVLDSASTPLLNSVADITNRCPGINIDITGHTDNVGSKSANQKLSEKRAKSVADYLTGKGVAAGRIQSAGYGDARPVVPNDSKANKAKNRRIEFKVIKG